jgi:hypothetical protein
LHFILTKKAGSLKEGKPYEMKYTDSYGNMCTRYIKRPDAISKFFATSNVIDTHNQLHQDLLQLEKKWLTNNPYFHLTTTLLGINVTDAFLLANHHRIINHTTGLQEDKKIGIQRFAGMLAFQLLNNAKRLGCPRQRFVPEEVQQVPQTTVVSDLSDPSTVNSDKPVVWALQDVNGRTHYLVKFDTTKDPSGRSRTKKRK